MNIQFCILHFFTHGYYILILYFITSMLCISKSENAYFQTYFFFVIMVNISIFLVWLWPFFYHPSSPLVWTCSWPFRISLPPNPPPPEVKSPPDISLPKKSGTSCPASDRILVKSPATPESLPLKLKF